jgi:3-hydroxyisobutyrate dehydrogenase-like beta-hydroxyacid dehydrogenase
MANVSVIGLGDMGSALARALLAAGYTTTVWNRSAEKAAPLAAMGAAVAISVEDAVAASPVVVTCVKSHEQTLALLNECTNALNGKTVIELSTGGASEAAILAELLADNGADWMIGTISAYPSGVGKAETMLIVVTPEDVWDRAGEVVLALGGSSIRVGDQPGMLAALFAALFTARQGFMFGMIYGALVCRKAGIPIETYAEQVPKTFDMISNYHKYFAESSAQGFESPEASMQTYSAALDDVLRTFKHLDVSDALPTLFSDLAQKGMDAGMQDRALTALIELLDD